MIFKNIIVIFKTHNDISTYCLSINYKTKNRIKNRPLSKIGEVPYCIFMANTFKFSINSFNSYLCEYATTIIFLLLHSFYILSGRMKQQKLIIYLQVVPEGTIVTASSLPSDRVKQPELTVTPFSFSTSPSSVTL